MKKKKKETGWMNLTYSLAEVGLMMGFSYPRKEHLQNEQTKVFLTQYWKSLEKGSVKIFL